MKRIYPSLLCLPGIDCFFYRGIKRLDCLFRILMAIPRMIIRPNQPPLGINQHQKRFGFISHGGTGFIERPQFGNIKRIGRKADRPGDTIGRDEVRDPSLIRCGDAEKLKIFGGVFFRKLNQPGRRGFTEWSPQGPNVQNRPFSSNRYFCFVAVYPPAHLGKVHKIARVDGLDCLYLCHQSSNAIPTGKSFGVILRWKSPDDSCRIKNQNPSHNKQ